MRNTWDLSAFSWCQIGISKNEKNKKPAVLLGFNEKQSLVVQKQNKQKICDTSVSKTTCDEEESDMVEAATPYTRRENRLLQLKNREEQDTRNNQNRLLLGITGDLRLES